jgi:hypothetical protein
MSWYCELHNKKERLRILLDRKEVLDNQIKELKCEIRALDGGGCTFKDWIKGLFGK